MDHMGAAGAWLRQANHGGWDWPIADGSNRPTG
jgi:hypothetical protein